MGVRGGAAAHRTYNRVRGGESGPPLDGISHYAVYLAEVGCKKAAAANVESVFSGAGTFSW